MLFAGPGSVSVRPLIEPALAVEVRAYPDIYIRFQAGYRSRFEDAGGVVGQLGIVFVPIPRVRPELPVVDLVWLPAPACDWVDRETGLARIAAAESGRAADGAMVDSASISDAMERQGLLVVLAEPGDVAWIGDAPSQRVDSVGELLVARNEGFVDVKVEGGGRVTATRPVAITEGHTTWVRFAGHEPQRILFELDSAVLRPMQADRVRALAAATGGSRWRLYGSFSPEGNQAGNIRLATHRAEAVREVLVAAGIPAASIILDVAVSTDPTLPIEQQRAVVMTPIPPGASP